MCFWIRRYSLVYLVNLIHIMLFLDSFQYLSVWEPLRAILCSKRHLTLVYVKIVFSLHFLLNFYDKSLCQYGKIAGHFRVERLVGMVWGWVRRFWLVHVKTFFSIPIPATSIFPVSLSSYLDFISTMISFLWRVNQTNYWLVTWQCILLQLVTQNA